jgi:hypothetical protein
VKEEDPAEGTAKAQLPSMPHKSALSKRKAEMWISGKKGGGNSYDLFEMIGVSWIGKQTHAPEAVGLSLSPYSTFFTPYPSNPSAVEFSQRSLLAWL